MKVSVSKMSKNKSTYRTPLKELDGMPNLPEKGKGLLLTSSTFESGGIFTSNVKEFSKKDNKYTVETETGSCYIIEIIKQ